MINTIWIFLFIRKKVQRKNDHLDRRIKVEQDEHQSQIDKRKTTRKKD